MDPRGALPSTNPRIPDYELLRIIGRGSYGDVWLARGITGLYRAVKLVWRDRFGDAQPYEREFKGLREFAAFSLSEARQLALLHIGRNDAAGFFYYVMELADDVVTGRDIAPERYVPHTLKEVRERQGRRPAAEVVALGVDLARALSGLHTRGLVHRDVKPSNVIFVGGAPKLADIGLVTAATTANTFVGTEGFVPPEGPGTPAADVFSLGKLLYETATGLDRHDYPRLPADLHTLPDRKELLELNEILIRACDPAATQRYHDAAALLDDLLLLQAGRSMRRLRAAERRLTRAVRVGTLFALIAGVAGVGAFLERRRAESENTLRRHAEDERDDLARKSVYSAGLARAQRALELGDLGRARLQLSELAPKDGEPDLRGFEWRALWHEAQGDAADILRESGPAVEKVRFSADGKWIAVQSADKRVTLWDAATKQIGRTVDGVHRLAGFSSDGRWLVGTDSKYALQRWTVADGTPGGPPVGGVNRPLAALGSNGAVFFTDGTADAPHALRVWDFARDAEVARIEIGAAPDGTRWDFYRGTVSADGAICALALVNGREHQARWKLQVIDVLRRRILYEADTTRRPWSIGLSFNGTRFAAAFDRTLEVEVRQVSDGGLVWKRIVGTSATHTLAFSADDTRLAVVGRDQVVRVLEGGTGNVIDELRGHDGGIEDAAWSPDGNQLVSASNGGDVRRWRQPSRPSRSEAAGFWTPAAGDGTLCLADDGRFAAISRSSERVDILLLDTLEIHRTLLGTARPIAFVDNNTTLLSTDVEGQLQRWSLGDPARLNQEMPLFKARTGSQVFASPDGRMLAVSDATGQLALWDMTDRRLRYTLDAHKDRMWLTAFSADGSKIVTGGGDNRTCVWRTSDGALVAQWSSRLFPLAAAFDRDARWVALGLSSGDIELRDGTTLALLRTLRTGSARVTSIVFSSDGSRLFAGGPNGLVHVYASDGWREITTLLTNSPLEARNAVVNSLVFVAAEDALLAYLGDGRLRVWRTR